MEASRQTVLLSEVIESFAVGVIRSTPPMKDGSFALPMSFESVTNWLSDYLKRRYAPDRVPGNHIFVFKVSREDLISSIHIAADEHPAFRRWEDPSDNRPFIDLCALWDNVIAALEERIAWASAVSK